MTQYSPDHCDITAFWDILMSLFDAGVVMTTTVDILLSLTTTNSHTNRWQFMHCGHLHRNIQQYNILVVPSLVLG